MAKGWHQGTGKGWHQAKGTGTGLTAGILGDFIGGDPVRFEQRRDLIGLPLVEAVLELDPAAAHRQEQHRHHQLAHDPRS